MTDIVRQGADDGASFDDSNAYEFAKSLHARNLNMDAFICMLLKQ